MLIHTDPFSQYATAQYLDVYTDGPSGAVVDLGAHGPGGRSGLRFSGDRVYSLERLGVTTSGAVCIAQFDFRLSVNPPATNILFGALLGASTHQFTLDINTDRTLAVYRGSAGTKTQLGSNSTYVVPLNTHIHIGVKGTIANSGGSIVVHVWEDDDTAAQVVLNVTGVDTQDGASATWDGFTFGAGCNGDTDYANLVVMDGSGTAANDLLGPADVWALHANARTTPALSAWALSAGSDVPALVDDTTPDDDTTYVSEGTQNDQFTVAVDQVPLASRAILGAQFYGSVKLTSGSPTVQPIGYQSGTPNLGTSFSPTANYTYAVHAYSAMPDGTAFSTAAAFDALQWGFKLTSSGTGVRATQIVVAVIQSRQKGARNLLTGYQHTVTGDDNVAAGQGNTIIGAGSVALGQNATVVGNRSVLINLDGVARTLNGDGKFEVYGTIGGDLASFVNGGRLLGKQVIATTGAGTYTPTIGTGFIIIELQGAGGGGGGATGNPGAGNGAAGQGGGGGGYIRHVLVADFSGASYSVGAKGTGGTAGNNAGTAGGNTTFTDTAGSPTTYTAGGGSAGGGAGLAPPVNAGVVVAGGACTNGDIQKPGGASGAGWVATTNNVLGSSGGDSFYGTGAMPVRFNAANSTANGNAASGKGGGGGGGATCGTGAAASGGAGSDGVIVIWEYA